MPRPLDPTTRAVHALGDLLCSSTAPTQEQIASRPKSSSHWITINVHVDDLIEAWKAWQEAK